MKRYCANVVETENDTSNPSFIFFFIDDQKKNIYKKNTNKTKNKIEGKSNQPQLNNI